MSARILLFETRGQSRPPGGTLVLAMQDKDGDFLPQIKRWGETTGEPILKTHLIVRLARTLAPPNQDTTVVVGSESAKRFNEKAADNGGLTFLIGAEGESMLIAFDKSAHLIVISDEAEVKVPAFRQE